MKTNKQTRVAIVGIGDVAIRRYTPALLELSDTVEICGICDTCSDRLQQASEEFPELAGTARFTDLKTLLAEQQHCVAPPGCVNYWNQIDWESPF